MHCGQPSASFGAPRLLQFLLFGLAGRKAVGIGMFRILRVGCLRGVGSVAVAADHAELLTS